MRRFYLDRAVDSTGVSGIGRVAEGVEFSDGTVVLRWMGATSSTIVHTSIAGVEAVHLHGGDTVITWEDAR